MRNQTLALLACSFIILFVSCKDKSDPIIEPEPTPKVEEHLQIDLTYRPLLQLFTSTGCGGCGRFGIPVTEKVAEDMGDSILLFPTHFKYEDPFITEASLAIEKGIVTSYHSPQIWVDGVDLIYQLIQFSQAQAVAQTKARLRSIINEPSIAYLGATAKVNERARFDVAISVKNESSEKQTLTYQCYAMLDDLVASQAGADPFVAMHDRVIRDGTFDGMGKTSEFEAGETITERFEYPGCWECDKDSLYFYVVVWKETLPGRYEFVNGKKIDVER